jgi:drug/metabolite transporter (DMT)-like permease
MFLVVLLFALFGAVCSVAKLTLSYASPLFIVGSRMFLAGVLLLSYRYIKYREDFTLEPQKLLLLGFFGLFSIYLTNILTFYALDRLESFKICFVYNLSPFISALFSYFALSETLSRNQWAGLVIGFLGFALLAADDFLLEDLYSFSYWHLIMLLSVASSVYGWILMRQLVFEKGCSASFVNGAGMAIGGSTALIHSYFTEQWNPVPVSDYVGFIECSMFLILISNFVCYNLYGHLLKKYTATFMSFAGFLTPLCTAFFSWMFLGEIVHWNFFLALFTVLIGLMLFYNDELVQQPVPSTN